MTTAIIILVGLWVMFSLIWTARLLWVATREMGGTRIPRCACGRVPLPGGRGFMDHPAVRHALDRCQPQREILR